jgi:hypothetical protein
MISRLGKSEFVKRLEENTEIGDPYIMGTPLVIMTIFGKTKKRFYGEYNKSGFRLTKNAILHPTPYVFEGEIHQQNNSGIEVSLTIKPIWFGYLWIRILPIFAFIFINVLMINYFSEIELDTIFFIELLLLLLFLPIWITIRQKNKLLKDFNRIFEIIE